MKDFTVRLQAILPDGTPDPEGGEATVTSRELETLRIVLENFLLGDPLNPETVETCRRLTFIIDCFV